jgi:hypothetical protein
MYFSLVGYQVDEGQHAFVIKIGKNLQKDFLAAALDLVAVNQLRLISFSSADIGLLR